MTVPMLLLLMPLVMYTSRGAAQDQAFMGTRITRQSSQQFDWPVVLVNCQLVGGAHEGQPGFTLILLKAVLLHQWVQSAG